MNTSITSDWLIRLRTVKPLYFFEAFKAELCYLCSLGVIVGLLFSKGLMSSGVIGFAVLTVLTPKIAGNFRKFFQEPVLIMISLLFFAHLLSIINSTDIDYLFSRLRGKLPYLAMPVAFASMPAFSKKYYFSLLYLFFLLVFGTCLYLAAFYAVNFQEITDAYLRAKVIQPPINHIRFSLMVAFAIFIGVYLYAKKFSLFHKADKYLLIAGVIFLFFFLHILSVRSGLLCFYGAAIILSFRYIIISKKYLAGLGLIAGLILVPFIALKTVPSLQAKLDYMKYDLEMYFKGNDVSDYSDARRIISWKIGWELFKQNPILGVGIGDLKTEMHRKFAEDYPRIEPDKRLLPHNEFLFYMTSMGILGLIIFATGVFAPLIANKNYKNFLFLGFNCIMLLSFMVDETLEIQVGVTFYLLFLILGYHFLKHKSKPAHD